MPLRTTISAAIITAGFLWRFYLAYTNYLNPDELLHFSIAANSTFGTLYSNAVRVHHPPAWILLIFFMAKVSIAEWWLRLIPLMAGSLFPWFASRWVTRLANERAGLVALALLTLSPNLVALSAQMRGYSIMLLFGALSLSLLERAHHEKSARSMAGSASFLILALFTEYSALWLAAGAGLYTLLRFWEDGIRGGKVPKSLVAVWTLGQTVALAVCALLYFTAASHLIDSPSKTALMDGYLRGAFPRPGQNLILFVANGFVKQCAYLLSSVPAGAFAFVLFLAGLILLRRRSHILLLSSPLLIAAAASVIRLFPFARSRHTAVLGLFTAAGIAVAVDWGLRVKPRWSAVALLAWVILGIATPGLDQQNIAFARHNKASLLSGITYLQTVIPPGGLVYTDKETQLMLDFYLRGRAMGNLSASQLADLGPFRTAWNHWSLGQGLEFEQGLHQFRGAWGVPVPQPVWVVDGGFDTGAASGRPNVRDFDGALQVFSATE